MLINHLQKQVAQIYVAKRIQYERKDELLRFIAHFNPRQ